MHYRIKFRPGFRAIAIAICSAVLSLAGLVGAQAQGADAVERGKYLAAAGDCISCHTRPGGQPFSGGLPLKTPFGTIYTANITSDPKTGIGGWTEEQFIRAMRQGIDNEGNNLYPAFPYTSYTKVSDDDVKAIYAYVKTLKPVEYTPPKNEMPFPFGIRSLMFFWNKMFFTEGRYVPDTAQSAEWNRGAYLVQGLGHCDACHTPRNSLGGLKNDLAFTGGSYLDDILDTVTEEDIVKEDGLVRPWSAVNLTSAPAGLGPWPLEEIEQYLKSGHTARAGAFGPMASVIGNSMKELNDADRHAMAVYIKALPAKTQPAGPKASPDDITKGEIVYTVRCGDCHLPTGLGIPESSESREKRAPPMVGNAVVQASDPATLINVILHGAHEAAVDEHSWPKMPGFGSEIGFEDEQIAHLCTYLRNAWGNMGDACTVEQVAKQR